MLSVCLLFRVYLSHVHDLQPKATDPDWWWTVQANKHCCCDCYCCHWDHCYHCFVSKLRTAASWLRNPMPSRFQLPQLRCGFCFRSLGVIYCKLSFLMSLRALLHLSFYYRNQIWISMLIIIIVGDSVAFVTLPAAAAAAAAVNAYLTKSFCFFVVVTANNAHTHIHT